MSNSIFEVIFLALSVNAPIQFIITAGQWLLMARFLAPKERTFRDALSCLSLTYLSAFLLSLLLWLFWPLDPELILYNNRISIPAIIGEMIAMPYWLYQFNYFSKFKNKGVNRPD